MKALKRLERIGKAVEELRSIVSTLLKEEQVGPSPEVKGSSRRPIGDSVKEEITKKAPDAKAADNADLLISEVNELLGKTMEERSAGKNSNLKSKGNPRDHQVQPPTEPAKEDTRESNDANPRRDFWFSLAHEKMRI